jgi:hypothetical protein
VVIPLPLVPLLYFASLTDFNRGVMGQTNSLGEELNVVKTWGDGTENIKLKSPLEMREENEGHPGVWRFDILVYLTLVSLWGREQPEQHPPARDTRCECCVPIFDHFIDFDHFSKISRHSSV